MDSTIYRLQGDRDIHIWDDSSGVPRIVAGCIVQHSLTFHVLYSWLSALLIIPISSSARSPPEAWYLVRARAPVTRLRPPEVDPQLQPIPPANSPVQRGHFVIRIFTQQAQGPPTYLRVPSIRFAQFLPRTRVPSRANSSNTSLGSPSDTRTRRSIAFRSNVRQRDGQCRVSGTRPGVIPTLSGGTLDLDYTGLQAAHIFPLAYAHRTETAVSGGPSHYNNFQSFWEPGAITSLQEAQVIADSAPNGILLRSDIHLFFDAYQFAFLVPLDGNTPVPSHPIVVRFNHSAAPALSVLDHGRPLQLLSPLPQGTTELQPNAYLPTLMIQPMNMDLLRSHLLHCLCLRVLGNGEGDMIPS